MPRIDYEAVMDRAVDEYDALGATEFINEVAAFFNSEPSIGSRFRSFVIERIYKRRCAEAVEAQEP